MTAGYSGTPLPRKLGIKPGHRLALVGAPAGFEVTLGALPDGVTLLARPWASLDVVVCFTTRRADLARRFAPMARALDPAGGLWVAWPKRASRVPTDLDENAVRAVGLEAGLVDNKVCAIDETWSGLRFVYRLADRPARTARPVRTARTAKAARSGAFAR
ncbi:MAG: DUF3052 family protein [Dehalococcoidia bacterium]|nr:DUF3052 family protein [Dehalococcoidia bacterium]